MAETNKDKSFRLLSHALLKRYYSERFVLQERLSQGGSLLLRDSPPQLGDESLGMEKSLNYITAQQLGKYFLIS